MKQTLLITSGNGPAECEMVVSKVLHHLTRDCEKAGIKTTVLEVVAGAYDEGAKSIMLELDGKNLDLFLKPWCGTIKWSGQSPYRPKHRRKNWFVGVFALADEKRLGELRDSDLTVTTKKASGPGGQHVNKTESCVRMTHKPTGVFVEVQSHRSQHMNRKLAKLKLMLELDDSEQRRQQSNRKITWKRHHQLERGNPVRVLT